MAANERSRSSLTDITADFKLLGVGNFLVLRDGSRWVELILVVDSLCLAVCDRALIRPHSGISTILLAVLAFSFSRPLSRPANFLIGYPKTNSVAGSKL